MTLNENSKRDSMARDYPYLSKSDSDLYDHVKNSEDVKEKVIKKLLEDKAGASRSAGKQNEKH